MDRLNLTKKSQDKIQQLIRFEQVKILHKNLLISLPSNLLCAIIIFISLLHSPYISIWLGSVIVVTLFRCFGFYFYYRKPQKTMLHLILFILGTSLSAILWGVLDSYFIAYELLFHQMVIIIIVAGITAGGIQSLNANLIASLLFIIIIIAPLSVWLFLQNNLNYVLVGSAIIIYLLFLISLCIRGHGLLKEFLHLQFENQLLIDDLSISNQKLIETNKILEHREHDIELINKMNDLLQTSKDLIDAYDIIIFAAKRLFANFKGGLVLYNPDTKLLETFNQWGEPQFLKSQFHVDDCWAIRKGQIYCVKNNNREIACKHFKFNPDSSICLPLMNQNGLIGIMVLHSSAKEQFNEYLLQLASSFSEVIQLSLTNIRLREILYKQSIHDHLTGLYNRRYMDELLARELQVCLREKQPLSIAMLDLDNFKLFNDSNGHDAGDEILRVVANLIKQTFRETDIPCRFGGEEFLIVLLHSTIKEAFLRLDYFRKIVKKEKIFFNDLLLPSITVSIGVAEAPIQGQTVNKIIKSADQALYIAKQTRDKTVRCKKSKE